jgi:hypothetical protein
VRAAFLASGQIVSFPHPERHAWCVVDGVAVFLDIRSDRYFRLPEDENRRFLALRPLPRSDAPAQPPELPLPENWRSPLQRCAAIGEGPSGLGDIVRAVWVQRAVERQLATTPLASVLAWLRRHVDAPSPASSALRDPHLRTIRAFERARIVRSAADRCLPRSIALALCLARRACRPHVVIGVKLAPFAAHCWVQAGDVVLSDELEEVLRYTPILVV